jgi:xanthine/uracil permease
MYYALIAMVVGLVVGVVVSLITGQIEFLPLTH